MVQRSSPSLRAWLRGGTARRALLNGQIMGLILACFWSLRRGGGRAAGAARLVFVPHTIKKYCRRSLCLKTFKVLKTFKALEILNLLKTFKVGEMLIVSSNYEVC